MAGDWIKDATANKGGLHRSLGIKTGVKIPAKTLRKATHSLDPKVARQARLAETLKGFKK